MPKRKRLWGKPRRRFRKRRKRSVRSIIRKTPYSKGGAIIHPQVRATLRYNSYITLNPAAGVCATHQFSANSLYDPDRTGVGHQPMGFDELTDLYTHYRVLFAKITITVAPVAGSIDLIAGVHMSSAETGVVTGPQRFMELPSSRWITLPRYEACAGHRSVSMVVSPARYIGKPSTSSEMIGSATSSPTEECFFNVVVRPFDESTDMGSVPIQVYITYYAVFSEPKLQLQS